MIPLLDYLRDLFVNFFDWFLLVRRWVFLRGRRWMDSDAGRSLFRCRKFGVFLWLRIFFFCCRSFSGLLNSSFNFFCQFKDLVVFLVIKIIDFLQTIKRLLQTSSFTQFESFHEQSLDIMGVKFDRFLNIILILCPEAFFYIQTGQAPSQILQSDKFFLPLVLILAEFQRGQIEVSNKI